MELLFLAHRAPFPPDRGDRIRSWAVLRHLVSMPPAGPFRVLAHPRAALA